MIITWVHLVAGTLKGHNVTDVPKFWGSTQVACWLQECPLELLPDNLMLIIYHSPGPPHPASSPAGSSETNHPDSWWNWGFAQLNISAQIVRNRLRETHLRLDPTSVWWCNQLQWANAHLRWPLAHWRSVHFMDESRKGKGGYLVSCTTECIQLKCVFRI